ncbi:hypothetical protein DRP04_00715 [Archaeoglobales archaeon]|nr:MAG: hypothetical protein DRP04_00715 [Archaeoglobales archaeon]
MSEFEEIITYEPVEVIQTEILDVKEKVREKIETQLDRLRKFVHFNPDDVARTVEKVYTEMKEEAVNWGFMDSICKDLMRTYSLTSPIKMIFGYNVTCSNVGVETNDGTTVVVYTEEKGAAASPEHFKSRFGHYPRIWRIVRNRRTGEVIAKELAHMQDRLGRAGGTFGWDKFRCCVAGALASFRHNFEALLMAVAKFAKTPLTKPWLAPNMVPEVLKREKEKWGVTRLKPDEFYLPFCFKYHTRFPILNRVSFKIGMYTPKGGEVGIDLWNIYKGDRARIGKVKIPPGHSEINLSLKCSPFSIGQRIDISSGHLVINPISTGDKSSITCSYVVTSPSSV